MRSKLMIRYRALSIFLCSLFSLLIIFGCGGGSGSGNVPPPSVSAKTANLQGKVDDGLPHSPIANAVCRFTDRNGTQLATATADNNGLFQLAVPLDVQGFLRCACRSSPTWGCPPLSAPLAGRLVTRLQISRSHQRPQWWQTFWPRPIRSIYKPGRPR